MNVAHTADSPIARTITRERLVTALIFALLIHGVILLGVGFVVPAPKFGSGQQVAVTLVNTARLHPPERAVYLAQANQSGPGNTRRRIHTQIAQNIAGMFPNPGVALADSLAAKAPGVFTKLRPTTLTTHAPSGEREVTASLAGRRPIPTGETPLHGGENALMVARLIVAGNRPGATPASRFELPRLYGRHPVPKAEQTNVRAEFYAAYIAAWQQRVEFIGSTHFEALVPARIRRGHLILAVTIDADGSIRAIHLVKRSRYPELDAAALQIIRLAAPFAPFPPALRSRTRALGFTYRWTFIRGRTGGKIGLGGD